MYCKKFVATVAVLMLSAFSVTAFGAEAIVDTTTTYNTGDSGKIEVETTVSGATADSEVTYIVKSGENVVYIDQDTATEGAVSFTYKIDKTKVEDYNTSVKFGSSATDTFSGDGTESLGIVPLSQPGEDAHYSITYQDGAEAWGYNETIIATVVPDDGYEITAVYIDGAKQESTTATVELKNNQILTADVQLTEVSSGLDYIVLETETSDEQVSRIVILTPKGSPESVGAVYDGNYYVSLEADKTKTSAVKIIFPADETDYTLYGAYKTSDSDEFVKGNDLSTIVSEITE